MHFVYEDENGAPIYRVVRRVPKGFRQERPDGNGGWIPNLEGVTSVPYCLPQLLEGIRAGKPVLIVEGERKVDRLRQEGFCATCNSGGAGKWKPDWTEYFPGAEVVVLPDNDDPGEKHGQQVARHLSGTARSIKVVHLRGLPDKGDIIDWLHAGNTADELRRLIAEAPEWSKPDPVSRNGKLDLISLADVERESIDWLWLGRIPFGKLTMLDGDPGLGKSTVTFDLASRLSCGEPMPDGSYSDLDQEPAETLIISFEDGVADTIRPRVEAAGGDLTRIKVVRGVHVSDNPDEPPRSWVLPQDVSVLEAAFLQTHAKLVVIDPLTAALDPRCDAYKDTSVRQALLPLHRVAERHGVAILLVRHLNKAPSGKALHRGGGSVGIIGAARSGLLVAADPGDETLRVLVVRRGID